MGNAPELSVLIATHKPEGILRVNDMNLPTVEGVEYVVSWQSHQNAGIPDSLAGRADIHIFRFGQRGISNNRNNAIDHAKGEILLMADDDLKYSAAQLSAVIETFRQNPEIDYASFMYDGADKKIYPTEETDLTRLPKHFFQTCFEIAIRRNDRTKNLRFNPEFGPGANTLTAAEDDIFLLTARRMRLVCKFFPIVITTHPHLTTGLRPITDNGVIRASGAMITLSYPLSFPARLPLKAWRLRKSRQAGFRTALANLLRGSAYALRRAELRQLASRIPLTK